MFGAATSAPGRCARGATRDSDEVRHPESMRKSVRVLGRRLDRRSPLLPESAYYWHGVKGESRPDVAFSGGGPWSEPGESTQNVVVLQSDLSYRARKKTWSNLPYPPPFSVSARLNGNIDPAPAFPLRVGFAPRHGAWVVRRGRRVLVVGRIV